MDDQRIAQFKRMTEADPDNELGFFSLGKAYLDTGRPAEAVEALRRAVALNPRLSKGYQLLGEAHAAAGQREEATEVVTRGVTVSDEQGDRVPRDAMVKLLESWGAAVPALREAAAIVDTAVTSAGGPSTGFQCSRCGRPDGRLEKPPFKGATGQRVFEHVCGNCWREWIGMGTKVINEMGLALSTPSGQETYDQYMLEFLQLEQ